MCDAPDTEALSSSPMVEPLAKAPVPRLPPPPPLLVGDENEKLLSLAEASDRSRFMEDAGTGNADVTTV